MKNFGLKTLRQYLFVSLYNVFACFLIGEFVLRIHDYQAYHYQQFSIEANPHFCLLPDPVLGFSLNPGSFEVTINHAHTFTCTHTPDSLRITSLGSMPRYLPEIYIMGCSYTYGFGIDDSLSYPFLLQKELPGYQVKNMAVPGFGTLQSFMQLKREISKGNRPALVVVNYLDFHDARNVLAPSYRKNLHLGYEQSHPAVKSHMENGRLPYIKGANNTFSWHWEPWGQVYSNWPGRETLSLVNFCQDIVDGWLENPEVAKESSVFLFQMIQKLCYKHKVPILVTGLKDNVSTRNTLIRLDTLNIPTLDMMLDLEDPEFHNYPYDSHPNARAHAHYAKEVRQWIREKFPEK